LAKDRQKFMPREKLARVVQRLKAQGKTVVFANGCFDLLHVGHLRYLMGSKALGDVLVVALNTDAGIRRIKGPSRPLMPLKERAELVAALECVDYVTSFGEAKAEKTLKLLRPNIQAKGTDYTVKNVPEAALMRSLGGKVAIAGDAKDHSTTDLVAKIKRAYR
jgi:rfaE bifunctional protein nucleotidyltransferase chain/domain